MVVIDYQQTSYRYKILSIRDQEQEISRHVGANRAPIYGPRVINNFLLRMEPGHNGMPGLICNPQHSKDVL